MNANKKARGDAKLKTLPEARQEQIAEMLKSMTLANARAELAKDGLNTSLQALSQFLSWWEVKQELAYDSSRVEAALADLKKENPTITTEQLFQRGQDMFGLMAYVRKDSLSWKRTQDITHRRMLVELERQKFQRDTTELFIKWAADQRAQEIANSGGLARSEKIEQLGQLMFGDDWKDSDQQKHAKDAKS